MRKVKPVIRYWNSKIPNLPVSFLGIPKAASSTVRAALGADPNRDWSYEPAHPHTFTVIREPVARTVSAYFECLRRGTIHGDFGVFCDVLRRRGPVFDPHVIPQVDYWRPVDKIFTVERLGELWEWLNIEPPKIRHNATHGVRPTPTAEQIEIIRATYEQDFLLYAKHSGRDSPSDDGRRLLRALL